MNWNDVVGMFREYKVFDEEELKQALDKESHFIPCIDCCREFPIEEIHFLDGDPYCPKCIAYYK